ncbi:MAG TPA: carboxypeptidase-like regulatory domain-containing protein, partial [Parafilimonas sp.]
MRKLYLCLLTLILICVQASPQAKSIMGNIVDESGSAVPFASIKIKNSKSGVAADAKGSFVIQANTGETLVISATGF